MTPLRQALNAAILTTSLVVAAPTSAQEGSLIGPPTASQSVAEAQATAPALPAPVAAPASAKPGAAKSPTWLAHRPAPKAAPVAGGQSALPSLERLLGLFVVLASLGAAVVYFKRKKGAPGKTKATTQRLSVVSSTRIGPKAHAVVLAVAGRQLLLGVTDSSVKRLAFIDELTEEEEERERSRERAPVRRSAEQARERGAGIGVRTVTPAEPKPGSFSDILKTAFAKRAPTRETDAASILAAETQDTVGGKPVAASPAPVRMLDVEGQAQGLIRRLGGPRT
jgi:flagellar biogenesis protein FliO